MGQKVRVVRAGRVTTMGQATRHVIETLESRLLLAGSYSDNEPAYHLSAPNIATQSLSAALVSGNSALDTPSAPDLQNGSDSGLSDTDNITNDNTPTLVGSAQD